MSIQGDFHPLIPAMPSPSGGFSYGRKCLFSKVGERIMVGDLG